MIYSTPRQRESDEWGSLDTDEEEVFFYFKGAAAAWWVDDQAGGIWDLGVVRPQDKELSGRGAAVQVKPSHGLQMGKDSELRSEGAHNKAAFKLG
jgi:hypothetical protein